ncbi:MAG: aminopeptidase, partial [Chthonomonadales bacterium]
MSDLMHQRFAKTIVQYSLGIGKDDLVSIRTTTLAVPLVREVYREALRVGANVLTRLSYEGEEEILLQEAGSDQLGYLPESLIAEAKTLTRRLAISAPFNTRTGLSLAPESHAVRAQAMAKLGGIHTARSLAGELRWCSTLFPTNALAQEAGMSLTEYEAFVFGAMFLDRADPIAAWMDFSVEQQSKVDYLDKVTTLRIVAKGTDITMQVAGRNWMNSDGKRNFPSGEVFTGPIEDTVEGIILFTFPSIRGGQEIANAQLTFEKGK